MFGFELLEESSQTSEQIRLCSQKVILFTFIFLFVEFLFFTSMLPIIVTLTITTAKYAKYSILKGCIALLVEENDKYNQPPQSKGTRQGGGMGDYLL
jgi:hypothetical protein